MNDEKEKKPRLWDVEIYHGNDFLGTVTVMATDQKDASNEAVKGMNVKIRRNYN